MTRDELEAILGVKEWAAGLAGTRRAHFHGCQDLTCCVPEPCEMKTCTETPSGKRLPCTMSGTPREVRQERRAEMNTSPGRPA